MPSWHSLRDPLSSMHVKSGGKTCWEEQVGERERAVGCGRVFWDG